MHKPRYAHAAWSLLVTDLRSGKTLYERDPDRLAFTGSVRKLFSVGVALNALGASHRFVTPVYRRGSVESDGTLKGDLVLVGAGDLTLGGRLKPDGTIAFTDFDHNDANNLLTAILTSADPLRGLDELAGQVRASGIHSVTGNVVVDDRLFNSYRVPNGNLLITPIMVNENNVDVWVTPTQAGKPARVDWRPKTAAFDVDAAVNTVAAGQPTNVKLSGDDVSDCTTPAACKATVTGTIAVGYKAPLSGSSTLVRTFRIQDPASFARTAFVQALAKAGVSVRGAPLTAKNPSDTLPLPGSYASQMRVAELVSPPYAQYAKLILKVSLNLGANLSLSLFGLTRGQRTVAGALASERKTLVDKMGIKAGDFDFPTNGSGSPDSRAAPRATVQLLAAMSKGSNFAAYRASLPILGVDGSLARTGRGLPAKGHVFAKTGTTIDDTGLKAQVLAGYIDARSGRRLAFALYVNHVGPIESIADVANVFEDQAAIVSAIYQAN
jgi:PBP4 family serine-type D-alanyl-D-alanine carboxypeptidase